MPERDANQPCVCDDLPHHPRSDCPIHGGAWKGEWHGQTVSSVERDANQLAADVREALTFAAAAPVTGSFRYVTALAALDELVGLVGDLKIQLAAAETYAMVAPSRLGELEAQVGTLQQERDEARERERLMAEGTASHWSTRDEWRVRAEAAEAALATTRQALRNMMALIVIDEDGAAEAIDMEKWGPVWVEALGALADIGGDTAEPCRSCGKPKGDIPTEHVDERGPGWKCKCGWWNWLDTGGDTEGNNDLSK